MRPGADIARTGASGGRRIAGRCPGRRDGTSPSRGLTGCRRLLRACSAPPGLGPAIARGFEGVDGRLGGVLSRVSGGHKPPVNADQVDGLVAHEEGRVGPAPLAIPAPGHTRGSACLLADETFLFSGDHVAWSPERGHIYAFRDAYWHDWRELRRSMARLAEHRFEWILPGHGRRCHFPANRMRAEMRRCLDWMADA